MEKWGKKSIFEQIVTVLNIAACAAVVVLAFLQIFEVWDGAVDFMIPTLGAEMLCQAYLQRKTSRTVSIFSLVVAAVIFVCFAAVLILNAVSA